MKSKISKRIALLSIIAITAGYLASAFAKDVLCDLDKCRKSGDIYYCPKDACH